MIPSFNQSGVLPPFLPQTGPTLSSAMAPYATNLLEVAQTLGTSAERRDILLGLIDYRENLRAAGITHGFQWVAGSFLEDCENQRQRAPKDIDIVTFARRPAIAQSQQDWVAFYDANPHLFDQDITKADHKCDAYYVDLHLSPEAVVSKSRFWFGLFSHQRDTYIWKGLLELSLAATDDAARKFLGGVYAP
ncbi:hypothetical protein XarbCFBP7604_18285 [Xanthomonas arboricola]|uniref:DUF6932 family protein n=1 Tax=Xanthomonas arboricola TaxID=56448 RepID=UPI000CEDEC3A|nr:hypothetical protein [Xanthomonas arboricola]PPU31356.1 hypothetical protein XarbCFBP7604_18285 [Xanthomonas arboricola]